MSVTFPCCVGIGMYRVVEKFTASGKFILGAASEAALLETGTSMPLRRMSRV